MSDRLTLLSGRECISGKYKIEDIRVNVSVFWMVEAEHFRYRCARPRDAGAAIPCGTMNVFKD